MHSSWKSANQIFARREALLRPVNVIHAPNYARYAMVAAQRHAIWCDTKTP
jgi:hypothetical protein